MFYWKKKKKKNRWEETFRQPCRSSLHYIAHCDTFDFEQRSKTSKKRNSRVESNLHNTVNASCISNLTKWTWSHSYYQAERIARFPCAPYSSDRDYSRVHTITGRRGVHQQRYIMDRVRPLCIRDRAAPRFCSYDVFISGAAAWLSFGTRFLIYLERPLRNVINSPGRWVRGVTRGISFAIDGSMVWVFENSIEFK